MPRTPREADSLTNKSRRASREGGRAIWLADPSAQVRAPRTTSQRRPISSLSPR